MPLELTTGVPGAGKTLYTVAEVLPGYLKQDIPGQGKRRLMIGGIPELLIEHEPITVPQVDPETFRDQWAEHVRNPGDPPLDVERRADNWWLWCMPGDVIVIDECQRLFRPMPAGRKLPQYIARLEVHRHYGVDFVLVTQHPQLLHVNVRNLIGRHRHVRRLFGRGACIVYEWDHCTNPDRVKNAVKTMWRHSRKAFGLYKSAELHTKHKHRFGGALIMLFLAVPGIAVAGYYAYERSKITYGPMKSSASASTAPRVASAETTPAPAAAAASRPLQLEVAGGYCVGDRCVCWSRAGFRHSLGSAACKQWLDAPPRDYWQPQAPRIEPEAGSVSSDDSVKS